MRSHIASLFTLFLLPASIVFNSSASHAQITNSGKGYLVRIAGHPGEKISYAFTTSFKMPATMSKSFPDSAVTMSVTEKILKVHGDVYTIQMTMRNMKTSGKNMPSSQIYANKPIITKMKSDGQVVGGTMPMMENMSFGSLYLKPLQIGHTYSVPVSSPNPLMSMFGMKMLDKITFVGFKMFHGIKTAEMRISLTGTSSGGAQTSHMPKAYVTSTGTELLSVSDGWPEYMSMKSSTQMPGMGTGKMRSTPIHMTMNMTMIRK